MLGKNGETLHTFACGEDKTEVKRWNEDEEIKSIGNSTTCPRNLKTNDEVRAIISVLSESVARRLRDKNLWANTVCLSIKTDDLISHDVMHKLEFPTNLASDIANEAFKLFKFDWSKTIRAVGVRATNLTEKPLQYNLFNSEQTMQKKEKFETVVDNLRGRFGYDIIKRGSVLAIDDFDEINPEHVTHTIHPVSFFKSVNPED